MRVHALLGGLLFWGISQAALADMHRCYQADGSIRFADEPCPIAEMTPPAPAPVASGTQAAPAPVLAPASAAAVAAPAPAATRNAAPQRLVSIPPTVGAAPATPTPEGEPTRPTKGQRDVLAITAQLQRCRLDVAGFEEKSDAIFAAWKRRHADVLARYGRLVTAKVRAGRHGDASLPLSACTDDWLRSIEPLTHMPDPRFSTVERTWQLFIGALMTGDRATVIDCLAGPVRSKWQDRAAQLADDDLRRMAASVRALKVQWGDDYEKEGWVEDTGEHEMGIAFRNINEEWKITALGTATMAPPSAQTAP